MIRLRGKRNEASKIGRPSVGTDGGVSQVLSQTVSKRHFLKTLLTGAGLAAVAEMGQVAIMPRRAEATYSNGTAPDGGDLVNTHLTVQGRLTVADSIGVIHAYGTGLDGSTYQKFVLYIDTTYGLYFDAPKDSLGNKLDIQFNWRGGGTPPLIIKGSTGNIGIGVSAPTKPFHVRAVGTWEGTVLADTASPGQYSSFALADNGTRKWSIYKHGTNDLYIADSSGTDRLAILQNGNVGIAQLIPQALLHLGNGAIKIANTLIADSGGSYYAP